MPLGIPPGILVLLDAAEVDIGLVDIPDPAPCGIALLRCRRRVLVDPVLELVDDADIADHLDCILPASTAELVGVDGIEELVHVAHAEVFHSHRMDLACIGCRPLQIDRLDRLALPSLEGMSHLVHQRAYIFLVAGRVAEDRDTPLVAERCAECAGALATPVLEIDQILVAHACEVGTQFR